MRVAFYAPMKPLDHPTPSGDRRMARLLVQALQTAGHDVTPASDFRSYDGAGDPGRQQELCAAGAAAAERLVAAWQAKPEIRPDLWFTYHVYHKAPDWLGPAVTAALNIPYVIAEPSHAPKRAGGPWDLGHRAAATAIAAADTLFCLTRHDMACVRPLVPPHHDLVYLPPFIDAAPFAAAAADRSVLAHRHDVDPDTCWLLAVAMMRPGDKLESYRALAVALRLVRCENWRLVVVGDGPARGDVEAALAPVAERVRYLGALDAGDLPAVYAAADLYVWPGVGEAYGMAYLEAQAAGLPVVAGNERGVPDVVCGGRTGLLVLPGNAAAFAAAVDDLIGDAGRRQTLAANARRFVADERTPAAAADILREHVG